LVSSKALGESFLVWESSLAKCGTASFSTECIQFAFNFLVRAIVHRDPVAPGEASLGMILLNYEHNPSQVMVYSNIVGVVFFLLLGLTKFIVYLYFYTLKNKFMHLSLLNL
jgi:hypothetical protein